MTGVFFMLGDPVGPPGIGVTATPKSQLTQATAVTQLTQVEDVTQFSITEPLK